MKWSSTKEALDCYSNSPCQHIRKGIENSIENMHIEVRVQSGNKEEMQLKESKIPHYVVLAKRTTI